MCVSMCGWLVGCFTVRFVTDRKKKKETQEQLPLIYLSIYLSISVCWLTRCAENAW